MSPIFEKNEPDTICSHLSEQEIKRRIFASDKRENHTRERNGKEKNKERRERKEKRKKEMHF